MAFAILFLGFVVLSIVLNIVSNTVYWNGLTEKEREVYLKEKSLKNIQVRKEFYPTWLFLLVLNLVYVKLLSNYPKGTSIFSIVVVDILLVFIIAFSIYKISNDANYETIGTVVLVLSSLIFVILNFTVGFFWAQINIAIK